MDYLAKVGRANRQQIAVNIIAPPSTVTTRLGDMKDRGLVHRIHWTDGSRVWMLTELGYNRRSYYIEKEKKVAEEAKAAAEKKDNTVPLGVLAIYNACIKAGVIPPEHYATFQKHGLMK